MLVLLGLRARVSVSQQAHDQDGDADRHSGADAEGQVQPSSERLPGHLQQRRADLLGELPGRRQRAAEGVPRGLGGFGWDTCRDGLGDLAAVATAGLFRMVAPPAQCG